MATSEQFRIAANLCGQAQNTEISSEEKLALASAAFLFAQVAEQLERGNLPTRKELEHCRHVNSLIRDVHMQREIETLLF
jgi:hypothetical protein